MDMSHRVVSSLPTGTGLTRFLIAKSLGVAAGYEAAEAMRDTPHILPLLRAEAEWLTKAGVDPMTTSDTSAAAPLAHTAWSTKSSSSCAACRCMTNSPRGCGASRRT